MLSAPDFKQKQIIFAMLSRGEKVSFKNDNIIITDPEGKIRHQSTCYKLFTLFIVGHITITSGLLQRSKKFGFSIVLLTHNLAPYERLSAKAEGNVILRKKQYQYDSLEIAQHLVSNKIETQIAMLKRRRKKPDALKQAIKTLQGYQDRLPDNQLTLQEILGIEGVASRLYFSHMFDEMNWTGRKPRVKHDITNLLLDIGYTLLFNVVESLLHLFGFDVYQGVYHQAFYQRKSLVCDLVEPFRSIIDQSLRNAYKLGQIDEAEFSIVHNQYYISGKPAQKYVSVMLKAILEQKEALFDFVQSYYRCFMQSKAITEYPVYKVE